MDYRDLLSSLEKICVLVTITYFASRTEAFARVVSRLPRPKDKLFTFLIFSVLALTEVLLSPRVSPLDARVISAAAAGLLGGASVGAGVGLVTGLLTTLLLGPQAWLDGVPAVVGGLLGGWVYAYGSEPGPKALAAFLVGALSHGLWLALKYSGHFIVDSWGAIAIEHVFPMAISGAGVSFFLIIIGDMRAQRERIERSELARAIGIANRMLPRLGVGLDEAGARHIAEMVQRLTGVPAAAIGTGDRVLAHVGEGADHHRPADELPEVTQRALQSSRICACEKRAALCSRPGCAFTSAAAAPLWYGGRAVGSITLYQTRGIRIRSEVAELGAEVAQFLTNYRMQLAEIQKQTQAVSQAELKALQAQVHPHFLFNALNTIAALCEIDARQAGELTVKLGEFFRSSLKSDTNILTTLREELAAVRSYLDIERARFGERLEVVEQIDPEGGACRLPSFTLQPIVENAILHGISRKTGSGRVRIATRVKNTRLVVWIIDNGRGFDARSIQWSPNGSHALPMLASRLERIYERNYGLRIRSRPGEGTVVCLWVPVSQRTA